MAVHRLPSQFAPEPIARPVTPTCCCCCCCVSSVVAGSIALPLILHQLAPPPQTSPSSPAGAAVEPARTRTERRQTGIVLSAFALPIAVFVCWLSLLIQQSNLALLIVPGVLAAVLIGFAGYRLAGIGWPLRATVPIAIVLAVAVLGVAEFFLWGSGILAMSPRWIGPALLFIIGLPVISTIMIIKLGRRK